MSNLVYLPQTTQFEIKPLLPYGTATANKDQREKQRQDSIFRGVSNDEIYFSRFGSCDVSVNVLADFDLLAQQEEVWMHAFRGAEVNPIIYRSAGISSLERPPDPFAALIVLSTKTDTPDQWQRVGHVLSRLLSRVRVDRMRARVFKQTICVAEVRSCIRHPIWAECYPQVLLQIGYAADKKAPTSEP